MTRYPHEWKDGHIRLSWFRYLARYTANVRADETLERAISAGVAFGTEESVRQLVTDLEERVYKEHYGG